jgi:hypothetical protein
MPPADKRTILELIALYAFEPTLRDVYVEGVSDRALLELGLEPHDPFGRSKVYAIDDIEVPTDVVAGLGLDIGNKGRLLALAMTLERDSPRDVSGQVVCLVDTDLDDILCRKTTCGLVVYTSGMSLDAILATVPILTRLFRVELLVAHDPTLLLNAILPITRERVLHRIAADILGLETAPTEIAKTSTYDEATLVFNAQEYVQRFLNKARASDRRIEFDAQVAAHRAAVEASPVPMVHMSDFLDLLHFCANKIKPSVLPSRRLFRRHLHAMIEPATLAVLPEVREVVRRLGLEQNGVAVVNAT